MIERLNQIPLNDFIELSCGNYNCLLFNGEEVTKEELKERATKLIVDYRNIVNPSGMKALVLDKEDLVKERARLLSLPSLSFLKEKTMRVVIIGLGLEILAVSLLRMDCSVWVVSVLLGLGLGFVIPEFLMMFVKF